MSPTNSDDKEKNQALLMHLVMMLSASALQQMGKTINPATGKTEINMDGAGFAIDMLAMIEDRTTGNLTDDENKMLQSQLATLRLNFFETSEQLKRDSQASSGTPDGKTNPSQSAAASQEAVAEPTPPEEAKESSSPTNQEPEVTLPPDSKPDDNTPRYHKSYG